MTEVHKRLQAQIRAWRAMHYARPVGAIVRPK